MKAQTYWVMIGYKASVWTGKLLVKSGKARYMRYSIKTFQPGLRDTGSDKNFFEICFACDASYHGGFTIIVISSLLSHKIRHTLPEI